MTATSRPAVAAPRERLRLLIRGTVQGVGFRPFVYRQANARHIGGWVANTPAGVTIEAEGSPEAIAAFLHHLRNDAPPHARIAAIETQSLPPTGSADFAIVASASDGRHGAAVLPDLATCPDCLRELFDPLNRRYRYPFINCTQCGPRYSIIEDLPYDRGRTSMRGFRMCAACRAEYGDPANRRFHAEPNACPECGPELELRDPGGGAEASGERALMAAADAIHAGAIVAVKGLGGFHLFADARNEAAIRRLRERKHREAKPFAVMFPSLLAVEMACALTATESTALTSPERPIVLVRRGRGHLADAVAPGNPLVGALLPYTPLHHLLLHELAFPVIATSGNRSGEPIVTEESEAVRCLAGIADLYLVHDRPIVRPVDDSVMRVVAGRPMLLRRARGFAPAPVVERKLPEGILALGAHLKSTVALSLEHGAVLSQHIGDLETAAARDAYDHAREDMVGLHAAAPRLAVHDLHPDYHSSRAAEASGLPKLAVQHHLAHVVAAMAEHSLPSPVLGVAFDGTGYGTDGTVWGGEFLEVTATGWRRFAHLRPFRLPGSEAAIREPRRAALGLLFAAFGRDGPAMTDLAPVAAFSPLERETITTMLDRGTNAPLTTSAGRLFDAVAALAGIRHRASYEGEAAAELEWAAMSADAEHRSRGAWGYPFLRHDGITPDVPLIVDWMPAVERILADLRSGAPAATIALRFHRGLAAAVAEVAVRAGIGDVVLTGGCFQNACLAELVIDALRMAGLTPHWHQAVPPNDGGIALGQAMWAARLIERGELTCA